MNKKGLAEGALAVIILALVTMGVLGLFVYQYSQRQSCVQKVELCKTSLMIIEGFKKTTGHSAVPVEPIIDCPICVPESSEEIKGKTKEQTMREIADHLRYCWYKTNGRNNKIGTDLGKFAYLPKVGVEIVEPDLRVCLVCSEFTAEQTISAQELSIYLRATKIVNGPGKGLTYSNYLDMSWDVNQLLQPATIYYLDTLLRTTPSTPFEIISDLIEGKTLPKKVLTSAEIETVVKVYKTELKNYAGHVTLPIIPHNPFQVIAYHWPVPAKPFNQIVLVPSPLLPELPCDIYHYQKE